MTNNIQTSQTSPSHRSKLLSTYGSTGGSKHPLSSNHSSGISMHKPTTTCGVDIEHRFQSSRHENNGLENEPAGHNVGITRHPAQYEHLIKTRQYYRDMVLGVNDGLVSTFLLVAGVVGGGMDVKAILLTAVSGAIAGAISMFAGEYVATKSQNEVMTGEIKLEHEHIKNYHSEEMKEVSSLLSLIGIASAHPETNLNVDNLTSNHASTSGHTTTTREEAHELKKRIVQYYSSNPDALLKMMIALELGVIGDEVRSPVIAGMTSLSLFFVGALPSALPFAFVSDPLTGMMAAGLATGVGLLVVGAVKTWATRGNMWLAALENLLITVAGGGVAYVIGVGFQRVIGDEE